MPILYVTEQGATIRHLAGRVVVRREDRILSDLPDFKCEQIVVFGNVQLTTDLISFCLAQGVDVAFLSTHGKYRGRLQSPLAKNATLRLRQYERTSNSEFCLRNAAAIVSGKIDNMIAAVRRQRRLREDGRSPVAELEAVRANLPRAQTLDSLNGYEGTATAAYFRAFRAALKGDWEFDTRNYHPPADPANSLLSFLYTLLHNDVLAAINIVGLDPWLGIFHRPRLGHAALASDLMEEHRSVLTDRLALTLLNKRVVVESDFVLTPEQRFRLTPAALKRVLELYARSLNETVIYQPLNIQTSYRQVIELQVRRFARVVLGEEELYRPFQARGE